MKLQATTERRPTLCAHTIAGVGARRVVPMLLGLLLTLPLAAQQASRSEVLAQRRGDLIDVQAQALVHAPMPVVWSTLTDYARLPDFIPGLHTSKIVARNGSRVTVSQTGQAGLLFLTLPIAVTLESIERPPDVVEVRRIAGTLRHLQGRYEAKPVAGQQVQLRWIGSISAEADLPPLIGTALARISIQAQFDGMVREMERRAGYQPARVDPASRLAR